MMSMHSNKPEHVLKRAEEFVGVGKKESALRIIFEMLSNKRGRNWSPAHESLMIRYLELCIEEKSSRYAKEGLHQFRNMSVQQAPNSVEKVIEYLLDVTIKKTHEAAAECNFKTIAREVEDLENDKSPESILLEAVTADKTKERTEREILVPWLKFLWENFRTVIELLRHQAKLEQLYHDTARKALAFCKDYSRSTEFRRLCELLRSHIHPRNQKIEEVVTDENMGLHLETRFEQLKVASNLRIWHEGFRTIEDIHQIMSISNKRPSSKLMANYYQKLTQLFLVGENYLFHAYAFKAYHSLTKEKNKTISKEELKTMASSVLLAAMSIPLQNSKAGKTLNEESAQKEKNRRMAQLLGFDINPKRKTILKELINQGILEAVNDEVKQIYYLLESPTDPLELIESITPLFLFLNEQEKLRCYSNPIQELLIVRLVSQLASIFQTVKLEYFKGLLQNLNIDYIEVEKTLVKALKARQIGNQSVRIDHRQNCITFGDSFMEEDHTKSYLVNLTVGLTEVCRLIDEETYGEEKNPELDEENYNLTNYIKENFESDNLRILQRKEIIEQRNTEYERLQVERKLYEQQSKIGEIEEKKRQELERKEKELELREQQRLEKLKEEQKLFELKQQMLAQGLDIGGVDLAKLTPEERVEVIRKAQDKQREEALKAEKKLREAREKVNGYVRAKRELQRPKIVALVESLNREEKMKNEKTWRDELINAEATHKLSVELKHKLSKVTQYRSVFETPLLEIWQAEADKEYKNSIEIVRRQQRLEKLERARKNLKEAKEKQKKEEEAERKKAEEEVRRKKELEEREEKDRLEKERRSQFKGAKREGEDGEEETEKVWRRGIAPAGPSIAKEISVSKEPERELTWTRGGAHKEMKESTFGFKERERTPIAAEADAAWRGAASKQTPIVGTSVEASRERPRFFNSKLEKPSQPAEDAQISKEFKPSPFSSRTTPTAEAADNQKSIAVENQWARGGVANREAIEKSIVQQPSIPLVASESSGEPAKRAYVPPQRRGIVTAAMPPAFGSKTTNEPTNDSSRGKSGVFSQTRNSNTNTGESSPWRTNK